jgi:hypothetical protein
MSSRKHSPTRQEIKARIDEETRRLRELEQAYSVMLSHDNVPARTFERTILRIQDAKEEITHLKQQLTQVSW